MCAFVRRNCPARRDHRETVAKTALRGARIMHGACPETRAGCLTATRECKLGCGPLRWCNKTSSPL
eukprot:5128075-Prymnesium_polylepis.1